jgi:DNA-binding NarL/FixJ family response regulator
MTVRVAIVDDHPLVVDGLRAALGRQRGIDVVGVAGSIGEARTLMGIVHPDVILLDLRLPDGSGMDLLAEYRVREDSPAFIVVSTFMSDQYVNAAIALGASGFVQKTTRGDLVRDAILDVAGGKLAFSADQLRASWRAGWTPLTARERDVIAGVMAGESNDELSARLAVSRKTIESYLTRLFDRFGVVTRTELAVLAEREQWLALPVARTGRISDRREEGGRRPVRGPRNTST